MCACVYSVYSVCVYVQCVCVQCVCVQCVCVQCVSVCELQMGGDVTHWVVFNRTGESVQCMYSVYVYSVCIKFRDDYNLQKSS